MELNCGCCGKPSSKCTCYEFPGWGKVLNLVDVSTEQRDASEPTQRRLGRWRATAICGNDITSSCLYVSALAALYAGPFAPLALLTVAAILYLFRSIYAEVGSALPLNGGAYNVLLNTTTKGRAAVAACLTVLSYIATAVISGTEAMSYAAAMFAGMNVLWATVILLGVFALINILGISDSASVALAIFIFHLATLTLLVLIGFVAWLCDPTVFFANLATPIEQWPTPRSGSLAVLVALFFGFSAAMLGISGFESSANYIEEQRPGVFPKTLRNMWIAVAVFNPTISLLSFALIPMNEIATHKQALLAEMGSRGAMTILGQSSNTSVPSLIASLISVDAVVVLSGAVLTSYVGVTGLIRRMSMDLCLPQFLLQRNRWRDTNHWIVIAFFLLCVSILLMTSGQIEMLAGVYTLSFLAVMGLFAIGNLLLKRKHPDLRRSTCARTPTVVVALGGVSLALIGNVLLNPEYVRVFLVYFCTAVALVMLSFFRSRLLTVVLRVGSQLCRFPLFRQTKWRAALAAMLEQVQCRSIVFVASQGTANELRHAAEYVRHNEQMRFLKVVWCYETTSQIPAELTAIRDEVDRAFPTLHIDLLLVRGPLGPELLASLAERLSVPRNYIFITATTAAQTDDLARWGGVRIIA